LIVKLKLQLESSDDESDESRSNSLFLSNPSAEADTEDVMEALAENSS